MSHIAKYGTALRGVNPQLMRSALEVVAKKFGGQISKSVADYSGHQVKDWDGSEIFLALKTDKLPSGVAVVLDEKNNPSFVALVDQGGSAIAELRKEIEFTYKTLAVHAALDQLGYKVSPNSFESGVLLEGEKS